MASTRHLQLAFTLVAMGLLLTSEAQVLRKRTTLLMGSRFDITIVAKDSTAAEHYIDTVIAEVRRIEYLISDWKAETQISAVNRNAGIAPVKVDREVFEAHQWRFRYQLCRNG
jgi:thiamine biosynthesis lipoprotein